MTCVNMNDLENSNGRNTGLEHKKEVNNVEDNNKQSFHSESHSRTCSANNQTNFVFGYPYVTWRIR